MLKRGDYMRITKLRGAPCEPVMWARYDNPTMTLLCNGTGWYKYPPQPFGYNSKYPLPGSGWALEHSHGGIEYTIVPEDELPDEYWAALALQTLAPLDASNIEGED